MRKNEIKHGRVISVNAENIWGWGSVAGKMRAARRIKLFIDRGAIEKGKNILEIGCGTGIFTVGAAETGANVTAVDISPELLNIAKTYHVGSNIKYLTEDAENMSFADGEFDVVMGNSVLHHLNLSLALPEIHRVLKKGGCALFSEPNMLNPQIMLQKKFPPLKKIMGDSQDETAFFKWSLAGIFREYGFRSVAAAPYDFLHPAIPEFMISAMKRLAELAERIPVLREISGSLFIYAEKPLKAENQNV
ncbi:class I SAM-dependent methyltransferase [bacterium]|nr:class I SAM-dependent methyltransferase [bacterium]MBU3956369.1 class I SAM-dependent methyltransferase [bacterium]